MQFADRARRVYRGTEAAGLEKGGEKDFLCVLPRFLKATTDHALYARHNPPHSAEWLWGRRARVMPTDSDKSASRRMRFFSLSLILVANRELCLLSSARRSALALDVKTHITYNACIDVGCVNAFVASLVQSYFLVFFFLARVISRP